MSKANREVKKLGLTQSRLMEVITYDAETGRFVWGAHGTKPHQVAGTINEEGYRRIQVDGTIYYANQLAWLYVKGVWPEGIIDHKNRVTSDDRFTNLREATNGQNRANSKVGKNNALGIKGVRKHRNGQYEARIRVNGSAIYLGCYRTIDAAKAVYDAAAASAFGEFHAP